MLPNVYRYIEKRSYPLPLFPAAIILTSVPSLVRMSDLYKEWFGMSSTDTHRKGEGGKEIW